MSIRFVVQDRATGETVTVSAPRSTEYVKKGERHYVPPAKEDRAKLMMALKMRSKLGVRGGCLA
jgi:hypothetical protein